MTSNKQPNGTFQGLRKMRKKNLNPKSTEEKEIIKTRA
jgi:hypothetical protein